MRAWSWLSALGVSLSLLGACGHSEGGGPSGSAGQASGGSSAGHAGSATAGKSGEATTAGASGAGSGGSSSGGKPAGGEPSGGTTSAGGDGGAAPLVDCDPRKIICKRAAPECGTFEVPSVADSCYGECVAIERCACDSADACPNPNEYTCWNSAKHCGPFVR